MKRWHTTAIGAFRAALNELDRGHHPFLWAVAQQGLGDALGAVGRLEVENRNLEDAIKALDAGAEVLARSDMPRLWWALSQFDRATALLQLGLRESGKGRLEDALNAYDMALREPNLRRDEPLFWALGQHGRGNALVGLAGREGANTRLDAALEAYRSMLAGKDVPFIRARIERSLASLLVDLGQRQGRIELLKEADTLLHQVTQVLTRDKAPYDWALTQNTRGIAFHGLGDLESQLEWWKKAHEAYLAALEVLHPTNYPLVWAMTMSNRGYVLTSIGQRKTDAAPVKQAIEIIQSALRVLNPEDVPISWANTQVNLGVALMALGTLQATEDPLKRSVDVFNLARDVFKATDARPSIALVDRNLDSVSRAIQIRAFEDAITAAKAALEELTQQQTPLDWAKSQHQLGDALSSFGEALIIGHGRTDLGTQRLNEAVSAYEQALKVRTQEKVPLYWAETQHRRADALSILGIYSGGRVQGLQRLAKAVDAYHEALNELSRKAITSDWASSNRDLFDGAFWVLFKFNGVMGYKEVTQASVPLNRATAQRNLGDALFFSGRLEEAVNAYRETLKERFYRKKSLEWAMLQNNLSVAQEILAFAKRNASMTCKALQDHVEVLKFFVSEKGYSIFSKPVLRSIESSIVDQMFTLNWQPRAEARVARKCLHALKPTLSRIRAKLNGGL